MYNLVRKSFGQLQHIAAIDVGSNAIRLVVGEVDADGNVSSLQRIREPVRLGGDVFGSGKISGEIMDRALQAFQRFNDLLAEYRVDSTWAVATSAVREAKNGKEFVEKVKTSTGIEIEVIDGFKEADLVYQAVKSKMEFISENGLIMDVGGGSVEFIHIEKGNITDVTSLPFGTVRKLKKSKKPKGMKAVLTKEREQIQKFASQFKTKPKNFVGTGGNIVCMGTLRRQILGKSKSSKIRLSEVKKILDQIEPLGFEGRMKKLGMRNDRADVIIPAMQTVASVMEIFQVKEMQIPQVGLRDGLLLAHSNFE